MNANRILAIAAFTGAVIGAVGLVQAQSNGGPTTNGDLRLQNPAPTTPMRSGMDTGTQMNTPAAAPMDTTPMRPRAPRADRN